MDRRAGEIGVTADEDTGCESGPSSARRRRIGPRCRHQWPRVFIHERVIRRASSIIARSIMPSAHATRLDLLAVLHAESQLTFR